MKTFKYEKIETNKRLYEVEANSEEEAFDMLINDSSMYQTAITNIDIGETNYVGCIENEEHEPLDEGDIDSPDQFNQIKSNTE